MTLQLDGQMWTVLATPAPGGEWISNGYQCVCTQERSERQGREFSSITLPVAPQERDIFGPKEEKSSLDKHQLGPPSDNHWGIKKIFNSFNAGFEPLSKREGQEVKTFNAPGKERTLKKALKNLN